MDEKPYYLAYERRYRKVFSAGIERWGHPPDDAILSSTLLKWVEDNRLQGKRIIDFACGEGAGGEVLSRLGCVYHGADIAPSAVERARRNLRGYPCATVSLLDMVNDPIDGTYDAAVDIMGLHMLILDQDRRKYLRNAYDCLRPDAPMLLFRQMHSETAPEETVESMAQWLSITGADYTTPGIRTVNKNGVDVEVNLPLVPGRARSRAGYLREMEEAGFVVEGIADMEMNSQNPHSVSLLLRKPDISK